MEEEYLRATGLSAGDLATADAIFDEEAVSAQCPACGTSFTPEETEACPECGLRFGAPG